MKKIFRKKGWQITLVTLFLVTNFIYVLRVSAPSGRSIFEEPAETIVEAVNETIPESFSIPMPYTVQAPFGNWAVHEESCEEAAVLMYRHFLLGEGEGAIDQKQSDIDLRALVAWQIKNWGPEKDLNLDLVGKLAKGYYGYEYRVTEDITMEDIKREIAAGHPVLVPVMTQSLKNPHYSRGDVYHILVIKGYDKDGIITNDAGIREGMNYRYSWEILWQAIDAQTVKMKQGRDMLVITK